MIRHLFVTALIVSGIYIGLLFAIDHPFVASAEVSKVHIAADVADNQKIPKSTTDKFDSAIRIYGLQKSVDFNRADVEVTKAWTEFLANKSLQNNVNWDKGHILVYVYFYDFNADMSRGRLAIGYDGGDLLLSTDAASIDLPRGSHKGFSYNSAIGSAGDKAWEAAYQAKNLIERHKLDDNGEIISSDVIIVE